MGKSPINGPFSIAMFDYRRVNHFLTIIYGDVGVVLSFSHYIHPLQGGVEQSSSRSVAAKKWLNSVAYVCINRNHCHIYIYI